MKKTESRLKEQYERALGQPLSTLDVLAFRFPDTHRQMLFNYATLAMHLRGLLYDSNENAKSVQVVFDKSDPKEKDFNDLAIYYQGQEITPIL